MVPLGQSFPLVHRLQVAQRVVKHHVSRQQLVHLTTAGRVEEDDLFSLG